MNLVDDLHHKVYIATATYHERKYGFVITWVTPASLSAKGPRILMVVSKFNESLEIILKTKRCCLNLLSKSQIKDFFIFGTTHSTEVDKFEAVALKHRRHGIHLTESLGCADVEIEETFETPDRIILYGKIVHQHYQAGEPLILEQALSRLTVDQKKLLEEKMRSDISHDENQFEKGIL